MPELVCSLQYLATKRVLTSGLTLLPSGTLLFHFTVITLGNSLAQHEALHEKNESTRWDFPVISKQNILLFVFWLIVWLLLQHVFFRINGKCQNIYCLNSYWVHNAMQNIETRILAIVYPKCSIWINHVIKT